MGLIGSMLAGAAAESGAFGEKIASKNIDAIIAKEAADALAARQESLARLSNDAAMARTQVTEAGAQKRVETTEAGANTRQERGFGHTENIQRLQHEFLREENEKKATLTREEIASREKIASANNSVALQVAKIGGSVTNDKEGNILFIGKDGSTKPIMDPNNPGKPLQAYKDLTPAAKAYADVVKAQLTGLNAQEQNATTMGDQAALQKITQRRGELNASLLNVLTGGISEAGKGGNAPYAEGTELKGRDGKIYVVKDGQPVLKDSLAKPPGIIGKSTAAAKPPSGLAEVLDAEAAKRAPAEAAQRRLKEIEDEERRRHQPIPGA